MFFTIIIDLPQMCQIVNGSSPLDAGYRLLALTLSVPVGAGISVQLIQTFKCPPFYILLGGAIEQTIGLSLLTTLSISQFEIPPARYGYEVILGVGFGLSLGAIILTTTMVFEGRDIGKLVRA